VIWSFGCTECWILWRDEGISSRCQKPFGIQQQAQETQHTKREILMNTWSKKLFTTAALTFMLCLLGMALGGAYDRADMDKLRQTNACPGCNLSRANLHKAELSGADLSGTNLSRANLHKAELSGADLSGADLSRANLHKANLAKANLRGTDLEAANLYGADLVEANLSEAKLDGTNLAQADLSGATWTDGRTCAQGSIGECR
jgi:uncharacterized protein YjbI with pentapeptide repeats